jgi:hypothetical protein
MFPRLEGVLYSDGRRELHLRTLARKHRFPQRALKTISGEIWLNSSPQVSHLASRSPYGGQNSQILPNLTDRYDR